MRKREIAKYFIFMFFVLSFSGCQKKNATENIIDLGDKREIFVDHYLIDKLDGTSLQLHHPVDQGPVFYFDKPWEGSGSGYVTIIKDGELYRMYYRGLEGKKDESDTLRTAQTCYAWSKDGIHWERPDLGLVNYEGKTGNNILFAEKELAHNFSPFLDTNPDALPEQRYKAFSGPETVGLIALASPDGIHWKKIQEEPVYTDGVFDSQNIAFWSESEKCYVCYFRTWTEGVFKGFRSVSRTTSPDFIHWTEKQAMSFGDTPLEHLYTNQTCPYFRAPHIYLAIGARFAPNRRIINEEQADELKVGYTQRKGMSDAYFMSSRGGNQYDRTFMESFIRPGTGLNNWVARCNYPALNVVQTGPEEMSIYVKQDNAQPTLHLRRYTLRLDGFTSINATFNGGEVLTKPFIFSGNALEINYSTSAVGEIRFEIQDEAGKPVEGFEMEKSKVMIGNEIAGLVLWEGNKSLVTLNGQTVLLRIFMKDADLYSLRFKNSNDRHND